MTGAAIIGLTTLLGVSMGLVVYGTSNKDPDLASDLGIGAAIGFGLGVVSVFMFWAIRCCMSSEDRAPLYLPGIRIGNLRNLTLFSNTPESTTYNGYSEITISTEKTPEEKLDGAMRKAEKAKKNVEKAKKKMEQKEGTLNNMLKVKVKASSAEANQNSLFPPTAPPLKEELPYSKYSSPVVTIGHIAITR